MAQYSLRSGLFMLPTPTGAYAAVADHAPDKSRQFLLNILTQPTAPMLDEATLQQFVADATLEQVFELLHHCQKLGWIQGLEKSLPAPDGALEAVLPELLEPLAQTGKVLLADEQGFYLASSGFAHETAEELSALSADIATLHKRRAGLLDHNLALHSHAWSIVDAYGHSRIGFWPLFIGRYRFCVCLAGLPRFNCMAFVNLIWALSIRYATR